MVNAISSGKLSLQIVRFLRGYTETDAGAAQLFIVLSLVLSILIWIFLRNIYSAILLRAFLEVRTYEKYPMTDILHFAEVRRLFKASWSVFVKDLFLYLWSITIIGGVIKHYSYYAVPYIIAENPGIGPLEAITLSRRMMNGHKMEAFLFDLSYIGWIVLGYIRNCPKPALTWS